MRNLVPSKLPMESEIHLEAGVHFCAYCCIPLLGVNFPAFFFGYLPHRQSSTSDGRAGERSVLVGIESCRSAHCPVPTSYRLN